jgi:hypothetical protein
MMTLLINNIGSSWKSNAQSAKSFCNWNVFQKTSTKPAGTDLLAKNVQALNFKILEILTHTKPVLKKSKQEGKQKKTLILFRFGCMMFFTTLSTDPKKMELNFQLQKNGLPCPLLSFARCFKLNLTMGHQNLAIQVRQLIGLIAQKVTRQKTAKSFLSRQTELKITPHYKTFRCWPKIWGHMSLDASTQALIRFRQGGFLRLASDEQEEIRGFRRKHAYY